MTDRRSFRAWGALALLAMLPAACGPGGFLPDMRGGGRSTPGVQSPSLPPRPEPNAEGLVDYASYQVAVAQPGDTVATLAARYGLSAEELARYNAVTPDYRPRAGELFVLPRRVAPKAPATGGDGTERIVAIATTAIDRAERSGTGQAASGKAVREQAASGQSSDRKPAGEGEPLRHRVQRGETVYSIARLYGVSPRAIADWNNLGPDMELREGQILLIPLPARRDARAEPATAPATEPPGTGSRVAPPPSSTRPLPPPPKPAPRQASSEAPAPKAATPLDWPARGKIIRPYRKGSNEGIDIAVPAGSPVRAAADGTVAAITRDTSGVPILVIRHDNGLLTVYANLAKVTVKKGQKVRRGEPIAAVADGSPAFLHFEVRRGFESVDPLTVLP